MKFQFLKSKLNEELEYNYDDNNDNYCSKHNDDSGDKDDTVGKYDANEWK